MSEQPDLFAIPEPAEEPFPRLLKRLSEARRDLERAGRRCRDFEEKHAHNFTYKRERKLRHLIDNAAQQQWNVETLEAEVRRRSWLPNQERSE